MPTMIIAGLVAAVVLGGIARMVAPAPPQSPVIYVQLAHAEPPAQGSGCLPLLVLVLVIVAALALG